MSLDDINKENKSRNLEEVDDTIEDIIVEKRGETKLPWWKKVLNVIFFPFFLLIKLYNHITTKKRIRITTKTTIIFTVLFGTILILLDVFIIMSVEKHLASGAQDTEKFIMSVKIVSSVCIVIAILVVAALGSLISSSMLNPIRKMINKIDKITKQGNLSERLDEVDAQDELKELTNQMNDMLYSLESTFSRQDKFISDASHELKTPISVIQGYANLLNRWGKNDPQVLQEGIDNIVREADNMKRMVEQLLILTKTGHCKAVANQFDLVECINEIIDNYKMLNSDVEIKYNCDKSIIVNLDKNLLTEAIRAIIDNAIKYSPNEKKVEICCYKKVQTIITIKDFGVGISENDLPHIFDRFYRCDRSRNRDENSTGLGLAIVDNIIKLLNGQINVTSKLDEGTKFEIIL